MARLIRFDPGLVLPEPDRVLVRAGCPPGSGRDLAQKVQDALVILSEKARPAALSRTAEIVSCRDNGVDLAGIAFKSSDLARILNGAERATVFLVTLGGGPEDAVRRLQDEGEYSIAHMLDAAASSMVEKCSRLLQEALNAEMPDHGPSFRYAPGYGDLGLECQEKILGFLGGNELNVAFRETSYMLEPAKSTTGVMGWHRRRS